MTEKDVRKLLYTINAAYPNWKTGNPEEMVAIWQDMMEDQDPIAIGLALKQFIRTDKSGFAPSIGQLIQGAYDLKNENMLSAGEAWSMVYKAICRANYYAEEEFEKFPLEVKKAVGSPSQLRAWASDPQFNEGVASSNFRRAYATACERKKADALISPDVRKLIESYHKDNLLEVRNG